MRIIPENKTLLFLTMGLIGFLVLFQISQSISWTVPAATGNSDFKSIRDRIAHEMVIRKRHALLVKMAADWETHFLPGSSREAELTLLKKAEEWAGSSGLIYDSVRMPTGSDAGEHRQAVIVLHGIAAFSKLQRFLQQAENANFAVSITAIQLKKESDDNKLRYELTLSAPLLGREKR